MVGETRGADRTGGAPACGGALARAARVVTHRAYRVVTHGAYTVGLYLATAATVALGIAFAATATLTPACNLAAIRAELPPELAAGLGIAQTCAADAARACPFATLLHGNPLAWVECIIGQAEPCARQALAGAGAGPRSGPIVKDTTRSPIRSALLSGPGGEPTGPPFNVYAARQCLSDDPTLDLAQHCRGDPECTSPIIAECLRHAGAP